MRVVDVISDKQLRVTDEVVKFMNKEDLEEDKLMLETRLADINILLNVFKEVK